MDDPKILAAFILILTVTLLCYYQGQSNNKNKLPFPPSPKADPIIGNFRSFPTNEEHLAYLKMGQELKSVLAYLNYLKQSTYISLFRRYLNAPNSGQGSDCTQLGAGSI